jgi:hypothetical protein
MVFRRSPLRCLEDFSSITIFEAMAPTPGKASPVGQPLQADGVTSGSASLPTRPERRQAQKPDLHNIMRFRTTHYSPLTTLIISRSFTLEGVPASRQPGLRTVSRAQH